MAPAKQRTPAVSESSITKSPLYIDDRRGLEQVRTDSGVYDTLDKGPYGLEAITESFCQLYKNATALDNQLRELLNACPKLGRSYDLVVATQTLREELDGFLRMFHRNARKLESRLELPAWIVLQPTRKKISKELYQDQLTAVAVSLMELRNRLNEFREYTREGKEIKSLMVSLSEILQYRAKCCKDLEEQRFNTRHIQIYIHSVANEVSEELIKISTSLQIFNQFGIPSIRYEQKRDAEYDLNISTTAIFFSAVTATTLQGGLNSTSRSTLHSIVMTFWFCSLVLSIGATLNSLLKRSTYGTHGRRLFPLVTIWIHGSGPLFLTLSIGLFVVGLVLYTYVSEQKRITSILTLAFAALVTFDVLSMSGWIFFQQLGWISPKIRSWFGFRRPEPLKDKLSEWTEVELHEKSIRDDSDTSSELSKFSESTIMDELPAFMKVQTKIGSGIRTGIQTFNTTMDTVLPKCLGPRDVENPVPADNNAIPLLENALRHLLSKTSRFEALPSSLDFPCEPYHTKTICGEICDLEYSHSGSILVVASFDDNLKYSAVSLYVYAESEREYQEIDTFPYKHHQGRMIKQVAWSPSGKHILVQLDDMIDLLAVTPRGLEREKVIWRSHLVTVRSVSWYTSKDIVFIAGNIVVRLPLQGETKIVPLENFLLRDVAVVPDSDLLLLAGRTVFKDIPLPEHSRVESQLKLFDMKRQVVCESIPSLDDMQYITIAASASSEQRTFNVLVGHKNARSPQLYELKVGQSRSHQLQPSSKDLLPFSEYKGSGYFVGDRQQMIFCAKEDNSIAIWDRETGATVDHGIPAEVRAKYCRRAITWNSTDANTLNFVTAGERELRFWSASLKLADSKPASASRPSLSTLAASSTPPTPSLREHVAKDTSPMSTHNTTDIQIQEVGRTDL